MCVYVFTRLLEASSGYLSRVVVMWWSRRPCSTFNSHRSRPLQCSTALLHCSDAQQSLDKTNYTDYLEASRTNIATSLLRRMCFLN